MDKQVVLSTVDNTTEIMENASDAEMLHSTIELSITSKFPGQCAPVHRARETIQLLQRETPDFIAPVATEQSGPEPSRLQDLACNAAACVRRSHQQC